MPKTWRCPYHCDIGRSSYSTLKNKKETGPESAFVKTSGIVTWDAPSAIGQFAFPVPGNSRRSLCDS